MHFKAKMLTISALLRSCTRQPVRPLMLVTSRIGHPCSTQNTFCSNAPASAIALSSPFTPASCSAAALTVSRRFGSGVSRTSAEKNVGGRRRRKGSPTTHVAVAMDAAHATSVVALAKKRATHVNSREKRSSNDGNANMQLSVADNSNNGDDDAENNTEFISPVLKRALRASRKGSGVDKDKEEAEEEEVETAAEDPAAPAQEEVGDDDEDGLTVPFAGVSAEGKDEVETRVDGVAELDDVVEGVESPLAGAEDDDVDTPRQRGALSVSRRSRGATGVTEEEEEEEENDESDTTATSHNRTKVGKEKGDDEWTTAPTSAKDDEANKLLAVAYPDLAAEYSAAASPHENKIPVAEAKVDSAEVAAWRCPACNTTWRCGIFVRCILKNSCPHCTAAHKTTMAAARPDLLQLWDHNRNNPFLRPDEIAANSRELVFWTCPTCRESYTARVRDRVLDKVQCPSCALLRSTSADALGSEASAVQQEWHPLKNGDLRIEQLSLTDRKTKVWWLCASCGHEWEASLASRLSRRKGSKGKTCPACHGKGTMDVF